MCVDGILLNSSEVEYICFLHQILSCYVWPAVGSAQFALVCLHSHAPSVVPFYRQSAHTLLPKWFGLYCISRPLSDDVYALLMGNPLSELVPGARLEEVYHLSGLREAAAASSSSTSSPPQASGKSR